MAIQPLLRNGSEASEFGEITHDDHHAVRGHSRSPISVPIERSYAISYISDYY